MKTTVNVRVRFPGCKRGAACKYAFRTANAVLSVVFNGVLADIARSGRLISWKSGNWSSQAEPVASKFAERAETIQRELDALPPVTALKRAIAMVLNHGAPGFRKFERAAQKEIEKWA